MAGLKRRAPPRIDATPEQVARAFFAAPSTVQAEPRLYHCVDCGKEVSFPDTLHNDGKCDRCHDGDRF